jgi:hypothetical protein
MATDDKGGPQLTQRGTSCRIRNREQSRKGIRGPPQDKMTVLMLLGHVSILWRVLLVLDGMAAFLVGKRSQS